MGYQKFKKPPYRSWVSGSTDAPSSHPHRDLDWPPQPSADFSNVAGESPTKMIFRDRHFPATWPLRVISGAACGYGPLRNLQVSTFQAAGPKLQDPSCRKGPASSCSVERRPYCTALAQLGDPVGYPELRLCTATNPFLVVVWGAIFCDPNCSISQNKGYNLPDSYCFCAFTQSLENTDFQPIFHLKTNSLSHRLRSRILAIFGDHIAPHQDVLTAFFKMTGRFLGEHHWPKTFQ